MAPHVVQVVTQPDRPRGRGMELQPTPVKLEAERLGIPVATPERARNAEFVDFVRGLDADFLLVASYGQILSTALLETGKRGGINLHGSLLPKYRGAAPIQRAIEDGENMTGVTLMQMDKGMDTGDMIAKVETPIGPDETYGELQDRLALLAADLIDDWAVRLGAGDYPRERQDENLATHAPKVDRSETLLDFRDTASLSYRRFKAFTPAPGVSVETNVGTLKLTQCRMGSLSGVPGEILDSSGRLVVGFGNGSLEWLEVQPAGKKRMAGKDFANGYRLRANVNLMKLS